MTSMIPRDGEGATKKKAFAQEVVAEAKGRDETRSFLNFSRENLSISHSDLEQGFNRPRCWSRRQTLLSVSAVLMALVCLLLEAWKLRTVLDNSSEIEVLKRDMETLKYRFREKDLLDELKAFEEQLYAEEVNDKNEPSDVDYDASNVDYDSNYEDDFTRDYPNDYRTTAHNALPKTPSTPKSSDSNNGKVESSQPSTTADSKRDGHHQLTTDSNGQKSEDFAAKIKRSVALGKLEGRKLRKRHKLELSSDNAKSGVADLSEDLNNLKELYQENFKGESSHRAQRNRTSPLKLRLRDMNEEDIDVEEQQATTHKSVDHFTVVSSQHKYPTKKYNAREHLEYVGRYSSLDYEEADGVANRRAGTSDHVDMPEGTILVAKARENHEMARRHLRAPRQVYAVHFGADSTLFSSEDEHTGNGRSRHNEGVFKAWRPSDWVEDLGMNRHFSLASNGRLTVHETGLYLAYAQIHYLDEHDENGFHLLVNGRPILQCMVYSPGTGHKSRSCFSAQVTFLKAGDHLLLKEVGSARYTLFQHDKSFFGLAKLGDVKPLQMRHPQTTAIGE